MGEGACEVEVGVSGAGAGLVRMPSCARLAVDAEFGVEGREPSLRGSTWTMVIIIIFFFFSSTLLHLRNTNVQHAQDGFSLTCLPTCLLTCVLCTTRARPHAATLSCSSKSRYSNQSRHPTPHVNRNLNPDNVPSYVPVSHQHRHRQIPTSLNSTPRSRNAIHHAIR